MNIIIHDLNGDQFPKLFAETDNARIISDNGSIKNCMGCFGCWIKTPGKCVIKDGYENIGELLSQAEHVVIISKCFYGGYSPFVKNIIDRSISYMLPFFQTKNDETHHRPRYKNKFSLSVYFYGEDISQIELETAKNLVKAQSINYNAASYDATFFESIDQLCEKINLSYLNQ